MQDKVSEYIVYFKKVTPYLKAPSNHLKSDNFLPNVEEKENLIYAKKNLNDRQSCLEKSRFCNIQYGWINKRKHKNTETHPAEEKKNPGKMS